VLPWLISGGLLLYLFGWATDWSALRRAASRANLPLFLLFTTVDRLGFFAVWTVISARAMRRFVDDVATRDVFAIRGAAELFRTVSNPLADAATLLGLARLAHGRLDVVLAAALVPVACHLAVMLVQATLAFPLLEGGVAANRDVAIAIGVMWTGVAAGAIVLRLSRSGRLAWLGGVQGWLDRFPPRVLAPFFLAFAALSAFDVVIQKLATEAFGAPIGWTALMARIPLLYLALVVPSLGNFGTRELAWATLFEGEAPRDALIAFAFATNWIFLVLNLLLGLAFLPRALALLREIRSRRKAGQPVPEPILHDPAEP